MNRRVTVAAAALLVVLIGTAVVMWLTRGNESGHALPESPPTSQADAREVYNALERLADDPDSLMSEALRDELGGRGRDAVPPGSEVAVDKSSWSPDGMGGGTAVATITPPGSQPMDYLVVMVEEADGWKIVGTALIGSTE